MIEFQLGLASDVDRNFSIDHVVDQQGAACGAAHEHPVRPVGPGGIVGQNVDQHVAVDECHFLRGRYSALSPRLISMISSVVIPRMGRRSISARSFAW